MDRPDERFEINDLGHRVDRRRAGDAHRVDVAARQHRQRNRRAEARPPNLRTGVGVERIDEVVLGGDDDARRAAACGRDPIERLAIDRAVDRGVEAGVQPNGRCLRPGQRRSQVKPATVGGAMICDNALGGDYVADAGGGRIGDHRARHDRTHFQSVRNPVHLSPSRAPRGRIAPLYVQFEVSGQ
jgi:hypothetical protein